MLQKLFHNNFVDGVSRAIRASCDGCQSVDVTFIVLSKSQDVGDFAVWCAALNIHRSHFHGPFAVAAFRANEDLAIIFSEAFRPVTEDVLAFGACTVTT